MSENTVRGSFTIPQTELDKLNEFTHRLSVFVPHVNRSEVIRVGIYEIIQKDQSEIKKILEGSLIRLKAGKPKKEIFDKKTTLPTLTVNDKQWREIVKLLKVSNSNKVRGRPKVDYRQVINGIIYIFSYEKQKRDIPESLGSFTTCWRRLSEWQDSGIWKQICNILLNHFEQVKEKSVLESVLLKTLLIAIKK